MKPIFFTLAIIAASLASQASADSSKTLRFAPLPMESLDTMTREYLPFMDYLEKGMNQPFEMAYHASYKTLISEFLGGHIDLAYLGPLPYVVLKEQMPSATPIVEFLDASGNSTYTCSIVHFADQPVELASSRKQKVGLTQPLSTCGYLSVENLLQQDGQSLKNEHFEYHYLGSHEEVARQIILGHYDFGGVKTTIGKKYRHLGVRIMEESDPMPGFLLIANRETLSDEQISRIQTLITRLKPRENEADKAITQSWGNKIRHGSIPAQDSDYNSVREKWKNAKTDLMQHQ